MKQIIGNRYIKTFKFASSQEASVFLSNQGTKNILSFDETFGDNYFCYVCCHSLTSEKQFVLSFSSDESEDKLFLLFWDEQKILVLDTGKCIYMIDDRLTIIASFDITTPLIGLFLISKNSLLLLEEASLKLVNSQGEILKNEIFDLIEGFNIENGQLFIETSEERKIFELT
ncbi:MAG TPA: hypothetical protein DCQ26_08085 [Marinilabiliales bacterium]|nr:MAG: hypothetical protein A2W96_10660 [Bacteroidetes bacterium GWD2_40_43]OFX95632.1 MAG: hypothetical protein A2W97_00980 [Bacteroidetes bacterium GWE2_40_63]OFY22173.1 MAG: hypothetical protein A2W88_05535 [Bacteroidetes bacterium GWF2_40_13]OFZ23552.1 MAG: hypothetical protein A2437_11110 [Bacteroidetes bacterium RIFOXYC2_FULL_40_12]HAM98559.1 hypothetical protein [Marinilabiliales bacterium]